MNVEDVGSIEAVKTITPKGGTKPPKSARIRTTLDFVAAWDVHLQVTGTGVTPAGPACQPQLSATSVATATGPCAGALVALGNTVEYESSDVIEAGTLVGQDVTISQAGTLCSLGVIAEAAGPRVRLTLYTSSGGGPGGSLVAETAMTALVVGPQSLPVLQPVHLPAGQYVLAGLFEGDATIARGGAEGRPYYSYLSYPFGDHLPDPFAAPGLSSSESTLNYYLEIK